MQSTAVKYLGMNMSLPFEISYEFFPPKTTKGSEKLITTANILMSSSPLTPAYFSVTFGAGGEQTQDKTLDTCLSMQKQNPTAICPHISCIGMSVQKLRSLLDHYQKAGITKLLVLRGDIPLGETRQSDFKYANELVAWIRETYGNTFHISVACYPEVHPQAPSARDDFSHFKAKVEAGADAAVTQYFFNLDSYENFLDLCARNNVNIPIYPGIMPISHYEQLSRFSAICGAEIPRWLRKQLESINPSEVAEFGAATVAHLCEGLMHLGAPGLHFYTLNQAKPSLAICEKLDFSRRQRLSL